MTSRPPGIRLYGAARCHKTQFYLSYLREQGIEHVFLEVEQEEAAAEELRGLYESGKLNFPTFLIHGKKLRNPRIEVLEKWLEKLGE